MNRRSIFKFSFGLAVFGLFSFLGKRSLSSSRIDVVFEFPENMTFEQYQSSVHLWVDAYKFERIQRSYQEKGHILSVKKEKRLSNKLINTFHFLNDECLNRFLNEIGSQCNYNYEARSNLGIKTITYINGQLKKTPYLTIFKS